MLMKYGSWRNVVLLSGLCLTWTFSGCPNQGSNGKTMDPNNNTTNNAPPAEHEHVLGPHGGHLLEMEPLHVELHMDAERNLTAFILGEDAKTAAPQADAKLVLHLTAGMEKKEIPLTASPLEGETAEKASRFTAAASNFPESVKDIEEVTGDLDVSIAGTSKKLAIVHDHAEHPAH